MTVAGNSEASAGGLAADAELVADVGPRHAVLAQQLDDVVLEEADVLPHLSQFGENSDEGGLGNLGHVTQYLPDAPDQVRNLVVSGYRMVSIDYPIDPRRSVGV